jgi:hypothetical protein
MERRHIFVLIGRQLLDILGIGDQPGRDMGGLGPKP